MGISLLGKWNTNVTVFYPIVTKGDGGNMIRTWSKLPSATNLTAAVQQASSSVVESYAQRAMNVSHVIYVDVAPGIGTGYRVVDNTSGIVYSPQSIINQSGLNRLWRIDCTIEPEGVLD